MAKYTDDYLRALLNATIRKAKRGPRTACNICEGAGWIPSEEGIWKQLKMGPCSCLSVKDDK